MSGPGDDSGQFHALVSEQIEQNRKSIDRLAEENRLLRDVIGRLMGQPPPEAGPGDELAAARRRRRDRGNRRAGFIALPIAIGAFLRHGIARGAMAAASAGTIALAAGATILAVDSHPLHPVSPPSPAAHSAPFRQAPGRARSHRPTPRRGQGKGTAARDTTGTNPPPVSRSRAAVPHATSPGVTQTAPGPGATTTPAVTVTTPPVPVPTTPPVRLPSPIPSVIKKVTHLVCHLNLLGIRVCVHTG